MVQFLQNKSTNILQMFAQKIQKLGFNFAKKAMF